MIRNFERSLSLVLKHEGGFSDHPDDPGGATNKGITLATMRRYVDRKATVDDLKRITNAQVAACYRKHYWNAIRGDELPDGLDYAVFDFAVNSGPARAARYLQAIVGVKQDGVIGPATLAAVKARNAKAIISELCDDRMRFLNGLRTWRTFGKGWTRRVDDVEREALTLAGQAPKPAPEPVSPPKDHVPTAPAKPGFWASLFAAIFDAFRKGA